MNITFLGTGCAMVSRRYNTCFLIRSEAGTVLVDCGGGNQILTLLDKAGQKIQHIDALFLSHSHCDHILGAVWVVRRVGELFGQGRRDRDFVIYGCQETLSDLETICRMTLNGKATRWFGSRIRFQPLEDGEAFTAAGYDLTAFDIHSTKLKQFGFTMTLPGDKRLCFSGDEPLNSACEHYARGAEWLLSEAFCLYDDRDIYRPYEKHHVTSLDAANIAMRLGVKHLVLYHTIDYPKLRRERMTAEAKRVYDGAVFVPEDLETISLLSPCAPDTENRRNQI